MTGGAPQKKPYDPQDYETVTWESWFEASRMDLDAAWFDRQIINANNILTRYKWEPIEVVYVKERTTWLRRNFTFKIRGQKYPVEVFQKAVIKLGTAMNYGL